MAFIEMDFASGGGGVVEEPVSLWSNPSGWSANYDVFTLSDDISKYKYILLKTEPSAEKYTMVDSEQVISGGRLYYIKQSGTSNSWAYIDETYNASTKKITVTNYGYNDNNCKLYEILGFITK